MLARSLLVILAAAALTVPFADAGTPRTESRTYTVGAEFFTICNARVSVGGGCFDVKRGETTLTMSAFNLAGLPEGASWQLAHPTMPLVFASGAFCGESGPITIPNVSPLRLSVFMDGAIGAAVDAACDPGLPATVGTLTATFS